MQDLVGDAKLATDKPPVMGSEDFAFMLEKVPGAYLNLGNGDGFSPHHPGYMFNDAAIPFGAGLYARLVELGMPKAGRPSGGVPEGETVV